MQDDTVGHGTEYLYEMFTRSGQVVYVAGQIPKSGVALVEHPGICGNEHDLQSAGQSARIAARQAVHWIEQACNAGEEVDRILRLGIFIALTDAFTQMSEVADCASQVFVDRYGKRGQHARSVLGVRRLPRNSPVLIEVTARLR